MVASFTRLIIIGLQLMCTVFCGSVLPVVQFGIYIQVEQRNWISVNQILDNVNKDLHHPKERITVNLLAWVKQQFQIIQTALIYTIDISGSSNFCITNIHVRNT